MNLSFSVRKHKAESEERACSVEECEDVDNANHCCRTEI